jgi:hypothetical protein
MLAAAVAAAVQLLGWPLQLQVMLLPRQLLRLAAAVRVLALLLLLFYGVCQLQHA